MLAVPISFEAKIRRRVIHGLAITFGLVATFVGLTAWALVGRGLPQAAPQSERVSLAREWRRAIQADASEALACLLARDQHTAAALELEARATSARISAIRHRLAELDDAALLRAAQDEIEAAQARYVRKRDEIAALAARNADPARLAKELEPTVVAYLAAADRLVRSERDFASDGLAD